jgi:hypothetical protein
VSANEGAQMTEKEQAIKLAERLLDEPNADPDDDLRVLSRQLLRWRDKAILATTALVFCIGENANRPITKNSKENK